MARQHPSDSGGAWNSDPALPAPNAGSEHRSAVEEPVPAGGDLDAFSLDARQSDALADAGDSIGFPPQSAGNPPIGPTAHMEAGPGERGADAASAAGTSERPDETGFAAREAAPESSDGLADAFDGQDLRTIFDEERALQPPMLAADAPFDGQSDGLSLGTTVDARAGSIPALAFATDSATEHVLRECLFAFDWPRSCGGEPQVRRGDLRTATDTLAEGSTTNLVIADVDGVPYAAGAILELAGMCEVGTAVIAIGSNETALFGRELLIAGAADYLVKPISVAEVNEAVARLNAAEEDAAAMGSVAGFAGVGGSGTTTLATAVALQAAARGRYVSVLDLSRSMSAVATFLDVEPAPGLDQLMEVASRGSAELEIVDSVCARRSDRIEVYAYGWTASPPEVPELPAVLWLIDRLKRRSQLVVVDGLHDAALCFALLETFDRRIFVTEPMPGEATRTDRMLELLGAGPSVIRVQNRTRAPRRGKVASVPFDPEKNAPPDIVVPFERSLPAIADHGFPDRRLPRSLRKPLAELTDRILAPSTAAQAFRNS